MAGYLVIGSHDYTALDEARDVYDLATQLVDVEGPVTLFLVQNGVLAARAGHHAVWLKELAAQGIKILADEFSLRERGIPATRVSPAVRAASLDVVIDALGEGRKVLWY